MSLLPAHKTTRVGFLPSAPAQPRGSSHTPAPICSFRAEAHMGADARVAARVGSRIPAAPATFLLEVQFLYLGSKLGRAAAIWDSFLP